MFVRMCPRFLNLYEAARSPMILPFPRLNQQVRSCTVLISTKSTLCVYGRETLVRLHIASAVYLAILTISTICANSGNSDQIAQSQRSLSVLPTITISRTCLYNFDTLKPLVYIIKLGFTGVYIIFLISVQKHKLWARRF